MARRDQKPAELISSKKAFDVVVGTSWPIHKTSFFGQEVTTDIITEWGFNTVSENTTSPNLFNKQELIGLRFETGGSADAGSFDVLWGRVEANSPVSRWRQIKLDGFFPFPLTNSKILYLNGTAYINLPDEDIRNNAIDSWQLSVTIKANVLLEKLFDLLAGSSSKK